jgi:hypothetical protein
VSRRAARLAVLCTLAACGVRADAPLPLPVLASGEATFYADPPTDPVVLEALEAWHAADGPFGAFFLSGDGADWGWSTGAFTAEDAALVARANCAARGAEGCRRLATLGPTDAATVLGLPLHAAEGAQAGWEAVPDGAHFALAAMPTGAHGYAFDPGDPFAAAAEAMLQCKARRLVARIEQDPAIRAALDAAGGYECRLLLEGRRGDR